MYKIYIGKLDGYLSGFQEILRIMRLTIFILFISIMQVSASGYAQTITFKSQGTTLKTVFKAIKKQTGYNVVWDSETINLSDPVLVDFNNTALKDVLSKILEKQSLTYLIEKKTIVIRPLSQRSPLKKESALLDDVKIDGHVVSDIGAPLMGTTITVKGTTRKLMVGAGGYFTLDKVDAGATLVFTYLGYETQEIKLKAGVTTLNIVMKLAEQKMDDVVITGTGINRKKNSFTGSASTFSGEKLKEIGNKNVIESLKTLDPSFIIVTNNIQGSNPNAAPNIEIRGKTTISNSNLNDQYSANPNQPLFILDGFESNLQTIYDLDMNRIASIALLKDAASTALYGAKAANGVVVVETKKPIAGQLQVSYTADMSLDMPDLSSYNLMNASEKLQFEKLANVYYTPQADADQWKTDAIYNAKLSAIARGVNTDWMAIPIQNGFTQRHSIQLAGGSEQLLFQAGIDYRDQNGVMKGSDRNTWNGRINLGYRKGKLNINNILTVSNLISNESPYGSFLDFAQANPYYPKTNPDGSVSAFLDPGINLSPNPLYNARLLSINQTKSFGVNENLQAIYNFSNQFKLQGGVSFSKNNNNGVTFTPPDNTRFATTTLYQKGNYTGNVGGSSSYSAFLTASYAKVIGKSQITANIRGEIQSNTSEASSFTAVGFPYGTNGNPSFAYSYPTGGRPASSTTTLHTTGILGSINYAYDERLLFDATYRLDGASTFGSTNLYQPYFVVGLGWNLHKESFLESVKWIDLLKLRANIGYTGNENLGEFTSQSVYTFLQGSSLFGQGLALTSLGNANLDWQNTLQKSYGMDFQFLSGRISGYVEYFDKLTDPLAIVANGAVPSSTGVNANYVLNIGKLTTRGYDFNLHVSPIYDLKNRIIWTLGLTGQKAWSKYSNIGNKLSVLNTLQQNSNGLIRYQEGYSPDDIWAVQSGGIDPANGNEIFIKKDGTQSFVYNPSDVVRVGNTQPDIQGVLSTSVTYKNLTAGVNVRYSIAGYVFNSALYSKVENISSAALIYNQDKRALYDRWQKPGDVSQFKSIRIGSTTPMSSRFVEKDTHFDGESFNLGYRLANQWIRKFGIQTLNITAYTNQIFRIESIMSERGTSYPYARSVSLSLNASF